MCTVFLPQRHLKVAGECEGELKDFTAHGEGVIKYQPAYYTAARLGGVSSPVQVCSHPIDVTVYCARSTMRDVPLSGIIEA